jgi:hypothetical protein
MDQILSSTRAFRPRRPATSLRGFVVTCAAICVTLAVSLCNSDLERLVALRLAAAS